LEDVELVGEAWELFSETRGAEDAGVWTALEERAAEKDTAVDAESGDDGMDTVGDTVVGSVGRRDGEFAGVTG
jgi:hypothetical protein